MAKNLELKAYCPNLKKTESIVEKIASSYLGVDHQTDTYFFTKSGRFKLRESSISGSYLIPYLRENKTEAKLSLYAKIDVQSPNTVKSLLNKILGIELIVKKIRTIYLYDNVRIHLDDVEELGTFIEFEAVFDDNITNEKQEQKKLDYLIEKFQIKKNHFIATSYENLKKEKIKNNGTKY